MARVAACDAGKVGACGQEGGLPRGPGVRLSGCLLVCHHAPLCSLWSGFSLTPCPSSSEIEAIKLAEQKHKAERRRRATVVVGDLQPLRDALPEPPEPQAGSQQPHTRG